MQWLASIDCVILETPLDRTIQLLFFFFFQLLKFFNTLVLEYWITKISDSYSPNSKKKAERHANIFNFATTFETEDPSKPQHLLAQLIINTGKPPSHTVRTAREGQQQHRLPLFLATNWFAQFSTFSFPPDDFFNSPRATAVNPITRFLICTSVSGKIKGKYLVTSVTKPGSDALPGSIFSHTTAPGSWRRQCLVNRALVYWPRHHLCITASNVRFAPRWICSG